MSSPPPPPAAATAASAHPVGGGKKGKAKKGGAAAPHATDAAAAAVASSTGAAVAPAASPSADALLDLISSKIDYLEGTAAAAAGTDDTTLTADELAGVTQRFSALQSQLDDESAGGKSAADHVSMLIDLYRSEYQQRVVLTRQLAAANEKLHRAQNQKKSLELLCKELQSRNKKLGDEIRIVSVEQSRNHAEMKKKFEVNLADIQSQLNKHTEDRLSQASENDRLRENLSQLLKFDSVREDHFQQQLKTKELEIKLVEAKYAQQADFAVQEAKKSKSQQEKIEYLQSLETSLRTQLTGYAEKFEQVQATLTKSNELFGTFKSEMEKTSAQMKKMEKEKQSLEKKNSASQLSIIQMFEERQAEAAQIDKLQRQNIVLTNLCKSLQAKNGQQAAVVATTAEDGADASTPHAKEPTDEKEATEQTTVPA